MDETETEVESPTSTFIERFMGDVNTGTYTRVYLRVKADTLLGEEIRCSGASFAMGQYNPKESLLMVTSPDSYPIWYNLKPFILPCGIPHHYMYALFTGGLFSKWEKIQIDRTILPEGREMVIEECFGVSDENMVLRLKEDRNKDGKKVYERVHDTTSMTKSSSMLFPLQNDGKSASRYKRIAAAEFKPNAESTLYLVCYHLPVRLKREGDGWHVEWNMDTIIGKSEGSIAETMNSRWVGCITQETYDGFDTLSDEDWEVIDGLLQEMGCVAIRIEQKMMKDHYEGYCKKALWPIFHNVDVLDMCNAAWETKGGRVEGEDAETLASGVWWQAYRDVNKQFAKVVFDLVKNTDTIWIHDYHLLLFGSFIEDFNGRQAMPKMVFFLHVPFPTSEIFRELANGPELLMGVLSANVVGFHSFDHARHFLNACKRFLGLQYQSRRGGNLGVEYRGRNVVVTITHIGVETQYISAGLADPGVIQNAEKLQQKYSNKILICGVDRCQRLSGVALKLLAFEQLLDFFPVWKDKVVLVQRCTFAKSRFGDQDYSSKETRQLVLRITKKHPNCIDYEECERLSLKDRLPIWLASDIMLHTEVRGGLNLKPLEYVFARQQKAGVVLLSEFSACCCVLNGAIRINPWNLSSTTTSLDQALLMKQKERDGRRFRDLGYITMKTAGNWTRQVLTVLQEATEQGSDEPQEFADGGNGSLALRIGERADFMQLDSKKILTAYKSTTRRIFLLDYGGTIIARENMSMYVKKDFTAVSGRTPSHNMMSALAKLSADPQNTVFVISGVSKVNLTSVLGHIQGLSLAAQNGALFSCSDSDSELSKFGHANPSPQIVSSLGGSDGIPERMWQHHNSDYNWDKVRSAVDPIMQSYRAHTNGSILQHMEQGIAWNYRSTDPEWGNMQANQLEQDLAEIIKEFPVTIVRKKGLLEIVPEGLHKGVVAKKILTSESCKHGGAPDFIFCIGDDTTDESMFKAIYEYISDRSDESIHGVQGTVNLQHAFTCTVGKKPSFAHLYVNDVAQVESLLSLLGNGG